MKPMNVFWAFVKVILVVVLLSPLVLVVLFAFSDRAISNFPITGFSLRWWRDMFEFSSFWGAFKNSMIVGAWVGVLTAVIGTLASLGLLMLPQRRANLLLLALALPLMLPPLFLGIMLLVWYLFLGLQLGLMTVVFSHLLIALPFFIIVVYARLQSFDLIAVDAARDLGASPLRAFMTVTLPIIQPVIVGAALMAVALSLDDFILASFTIGGGNTLPIMVMSTLRTSVTPMTNAVGTLLIALSISFMLVALRLTRYRG